MAKRKLESGDLAPTIRKALKQKRISQKKLAELVGVHRSTINRLVLGYTDVTSGTFRKICEVLGLDYLGVIRDVVSPLEKTSIDMADIEASVSQIGYRYYSPPQFLVAGLTIEDVFVARAFHDLPRESEIRQAMMALLRDRIQEIELKHRKMLDEFIRTLELLDKGSPAIHPKSTEDDSDTGE